MFSPSILCHHTTVTAKWPFDFCGYNSLFSLNLFLLLFLSHFLFNFLFQFQSQSLFPREKMVGTSLKQQLKNFLRSMHEQGIVDSHFESIRRLQSEENPRFVSEVINMFINDADVSMAEATRCLNETAVDYEILNGFIHQLRGSSSSIGGCRMALACRELRQATEARDKARCLEAFERLKQEYQTLRDSFNHVLQLERSIVSYETSRRRP